MLILIGCDEPTEIEPADVAARGTFIFNDVLTTDITDPYSFARRCAEQSSIEIWLRTQSGHEMLITMGAIASEELVTQSWDLVEFDFTYTDDPMNPSEWYAADSGWLEIESFGQEGERVVGLIDLQGVMMDAESGEVLMDGYHIRGNFDIPHIDSSCTE